MSYKLKVNVWQILWRLIYYTPKLYFIDAFFWLFIMGLPILTGLIIREFFNTLTGVSQFNLSPYLFSIFILVAGLTRVIFIFIGRLTKTQHRFTMSTLLRHNLLQVILNRADAISLPVNQGELISYFRDDMEIIEDNVVGTSEIFNAAIFAIISLIILVNINWKMTILTFLPLGLVIAIAQKMQKHIKRYRRHSRNSTEKVTGFIGEIFNSLQAIKVAGAEKSIIKHFEKLNAQRRKAILKDQILTAILNSNFQNLINLGVGIILITAANLRQNSLTKLTIGDLALFIYYLAFVTDFFMFLGEFLTASKQVEVSFERMGQLIKSSDKPIENSILSLVASQPLYLNHIFGQKQQLPPIQTAPQNYSKLQELTIENLTYHYPGTDRGIENINLCLPKASLTVITGGIGSGKTTLLRVLLGLLPLQMGKIYWNGVSVDDPASFFIPPRSAYTPQVPQLFSQTLIKNLLLDSQTNQTCLEQALYTSVFAEDVADMSLGLETPVGHRGVRLSGGQLQRAAIARALVRQPELLVFDDISSALDIQTQRKLYERLWEIQNLPDSDWQPTILIVSPNRWLCDRADQVIFIDRGGINNP